MLRSWQSRFLRQIHALGLFSDVSLAAHVDELGERMDRSLMPRYRSGDRGAPLGLLQAILTHCTPEEAAQVLGLLARPLGLEVHLSAELVEDPDSEEVRREVFGLVPSIGRLTQQALAAFDPASHGGVQLTPREAREMLPEARHHFAQMRRLVQHLEAL